ncbi:MAG: orotate phosphoribosyltransferase [Candidatus Aenigmarchaeota archaeon]|nr:orotate phosphoribosyltransferase [Candidatus Aenigmarchaeota archaeon]
MRVGSFRLRSGRESPYFINTGLFDNGYRMARLGEFYSEAATACVGTDFDVVFGPPYKGIPLAVATSMALAGRGINKGWSSYRKEVKIHGEAADDSAAKAGLQNELILGHRINDRSRILLVDDVLTTGEAKEEALGVLARVADNARVVAGLIAVDRQEVDEYGKDAVEEFRQKTGVQIFSIASMSDILECLEDLGRMAAEQRAAFRNYIFRWGTDEARQRLSRR